MKDNDAEQAADALMVERHMRYIEERERRIVPQRMPQPRRPSGSAARHRNAKKARRR